MGFRSFGFFHLAAAGLSGALLIAACSPSRSTPPPSSATATPSAQLWGDMKPVVSVKELMHDMIDPLSDNIFDSVYIIVNKKGRIEKSPKTDEDWDKIRIGGVSMAEGAYLLKVRRPFTPPGVENNSSGPDAVELSSADITAKVEKDPVEWNARIEALRNVGLEVLDIVKRRDADELWDACENLEAACEACHRSYWYPKENGEFYTLLNHRSRTAVSPSTRGVAPKPRAPR
jgi:hypothetical protein